MGEGIPWYTELAVPVGSHSGCPDPAGSVEDQWAITIYFFPKSLVGIAHGSMIDERPGGTID